MRRVVLVRLAADEAVEVLEAAAARRPVVERAHRARLPDRHLVALAELRGRVAVQLQHLGERRARVRAHRVVAGRRGGDLGDPAHADGVVVAAGQQRRARRRAQRRRVEAVVLQPAAASRSAVGVAAGPAERARRAEADVVEQHDQHVRRARRRPQRLDRRELRVRILRVVRHLARRTAGPGSAAPHASSPVGSGICGSPRSGSPEPYVVRDRPVGSTQAGTCPGDRLVGRCGAALRLQLVHPLLAQPTDGVTRSAR